MDPMQLHSLYELMIARKGERIFEEYAMQTAHLVKKLARNQPRDVSPTDPEYEIVLVETRNSKTLAFTLYNTLAFVPPETGIRVFCTRELLSRVYSILHSIKGRVSVSLIPVFKTRGEYNQLLLTEWFWSQFTAKMVLIFQTDSFITKKLKWEEYKQYSYIGAPWNRERCVKIPVGGGTISLPLNKIQEKSTNLVGNGGFSIRKVSECMRVLKTHKNSGGLPEDVFFSMHCTNVAPYDVARGFASETDWNPESLGYHAPWLYTTPENVRKALQRHRSAISFDIPRDTLLKLPEGSSGKPSFLVSSFSPFGPSGYGCQLKLLIDGIRKEHPTAFFNVLCWDLASGFSTSPLFQNQYLRLYAGGERKKQWSKIQSLYECLKPDVFLAFQDIFIFDDPVDVRFDCRSILYVPIHNNLERHPLLRFNLPEKEERNLLVHLPLFDEISTISEFGKHVLAREGYASTIIPHAADLSLFTPTPSEAEEKDELVPQDKFVCLMVARNTEASDRKAFHQNLEAFSLFLKSDETKKVHLILHTNPTPEIKIDKLIQERAITEHVTMDHRSLSRAEMARLYRSVDVLLACSKSEGFGVPIIECQLCGTPVVTTNCTAMTDNTYFGILTEPGFVSGTAGGINGWSNPDPARIASALSAVRSKSFKVRPVPRDLYNFDRLYKNKWRQIIGNHLFVIHHAATIKSNEQVQRTFGPNVKHPDSVSYFQSYLQYIVDNFSQLPTWLFLVTEKDTPVHRSRSLLEQMVRAMSSTQRFQSLNDLGTFTKPGTEADSFPASMEDLF